jgi:hypothetical protein
MSGHHRQVPCDIKARKVFTTKPILRHQAHFRTESEKRALQMPEGGDKSAFI